MSDNGGNRSPKSLSDVSHLFFSKVEETGGEPASAGEPRVHGASVRRTDAACEPRERGASVLRPDAAIEREAGTTVVVTGWRGGPGKSSVALNLAAALSSRGRVGLFDADRSVPNARFYAGLPSSDYLSPLTGDIPAEGYETDFGLCVLDWSRGAPGPGRAEPEGGRFDYRVVDAPADRLPELGAALTGRTIFIVVAGPGWTGFQGAYAALATLRRSLGVEGAGLIVNRVPGQDYAARFHSKMRTASERLLSMELHFLGGVVTEEGIGAKQRERGPLVRSRPDSPAALSLREAATRAIVLERMLNSPDLTGSDGRSHMENNIEEDRTVGTA